VNPYTEIECGSIEDPLPGINAIMVLRPLWCVLVVEITAASCSIKDVDLRGANFVSVCRPNGLHVQHATTLSARDASNSDAGRYGPPGQDLLRPRADYRVVPERSHRPQRLAFAGPAKRVTIIRDTSTSPCLTVDGTNRGERRWWSSVRTPLHLA